MNQLSHGSLYESFKEKKNNNHIGSSSTMVSLSVSVRMIQFSILLIHSYATKGFNLHVIAHIYIMQSNTKNREIIKL
jgi:hypothetical protein